MKKLFVTLLMVLMMVASVSAKTRYSRSANAKYCWFVEDSTLGVTNNWYYVKQNQDNIRKYLIELLKRNRNCSDEEFDLIRNLVSSYRDRQACIKWAEEHFEPRGGYKLTLSSKEAEYFLEWYERSAKQYNENLHAYQHWLAMNKE